MTHKYFNLHTILDERKLSFSADEYSRFKYGSKSIARKFGKEMAKMLSSLLPIDKQMVIMSAPYLYLPVAGTALKDYLLAELNCRMIDKGMQNAIIDSKIFRPVTYMVDYSKMSASEREQAIGSERFHTDSEFLKGKVALFVDDIRVTGSHEKRICEMVERLNIDCECIFLYYVRVQGTINPEIESTLNHFTVKTLLDLDNIIKNDEYIHNTRNTKFILSSKKEEFVQFIHYQKKDFRRNLYAGSLSNGYNREESFKENISYLKGLLNK